jgi:uridine kinase
MSSVNILGIAGGSCSGKTFLSKAIYKYFTPETCLVFPTDSYYKDLSNMTLSVRSKTNFDHPSALDHDLLFDDLSKLIAGGKAKVPRYNFHTHTREPCDKYSELNDRVLIVEGLFALYWEEIRELLTMNIFIDLEQETMLRRRKKRDMAERGRTAKSVQQQFYQTVNPMHEKYVEPCKHWADIILSGDLNPEENIQSILTHELWIK